MANLLRKDRKRQGKDTSQVVPLKRSPRRSTPQPRKPRGRVKPQANSLFHSLKAWLKKLLRIGK